MEPIALKIRDALASQLGLEPEEILEDTDIIEELGADSLDLVELIMELEKEFNISVTDDAIYSCHTVADLTEFVKNMQ
ncbi:MAG: acyl carrier protein [Oscillospiraceae bacterium]|jgi:acyl carrier protein|nr:acyl carrier protein [Oscillospiraceae bacterium]